LYVNSLAGAAGGVIANDSTAATNRLVIQGTNTTTFGGVMQNGAGGGGMGLTLLGGSLTMSGAHPYTGGTLVGSGASFYIANGPAAVTGGVIASNGATLGLSGGSSTPGTPTSITTVDGATVSFTAGALGKIWNTQFYGAPNTTNRILTTMSFGGNNSFSNSLASSAGSQRQVRFINIPTGGTGGGNNTTFEFVGNTEVMTRDPATVSLGHIVGGNPSAGINGASSGAGPNTFILAPRRGCLVPRLHPWLEQHCEGRFGRAEVRRRWRHHQLGLRHLHQLPLQLAARLLRKHHHQQRRTGPGGA
jgi:hypothetical protein